VAEQAQRSAGGSGARALALALCGALVATAPGRAPAEGVAAGDASEGGGTLAEAAAPFRLGGVVDVGGLYDVLTNGYPDWAGFFARGSLRFDARNTLGGEVSWLDEFGDRGWLFAATDVLVLDPRWSVSGGLGTSAGGFFLPRLRIDLAVHRKWLAAANLVTSLGGTFVDSKDGHRDQAGEVDVAYYLSVPWVLEGGFRLNVSDPGTVIAPQGFVAVTFGREKERFLSLRVEAGREAYQLVGGNVSLVGFESQKATFTFRQWFASSWGGQLRAEYYHNPYYDRSGAELGGFWEF